MSDCYNTTLATHPAHACSQRMDAHSAWTLTAPLSYTRPPVRPAREHTRVLGLSRQPDAGKQADAHAVKCDALATWLSSCGRRAPWPRTESGIMTYARERTTRPSVGATRQPSCAATRAVRASRQAGRIDAGCRAVPGLFPPALHPGVDIGLPCDT
eukprot:366478-Chlamydomonas_euryale.AAC.6